MSAQTDSERGTGGPLSRQAAIARLTAPGQPYALHTEVLHDRECRVFSNAPQTLAELYAAAVSNATFLVYEEERLTFAETQARAAQLAHALQEKFGGKRASDL